MVHAVCPSGSGDAVFDVAVIGLGPSGAVAAALMGQSGLRVLVVDKTFKVYDKPRAIAMDHEIMRILQGLGLANAVQPYVEPFSASEHFGVDGQMIRRLDMLPPPYPMGWIPSMVFLQPPVEQILRDQLATMPSVQVHQDWELIDFAQDTWGVDLQFRSSDGVQHHARARYLLGCDGASSVVRRKADVGLQDLGFDEPWLVVDVVANAQGLAKLPQASAQYCEPTRPASYLIGTGAHRRWEIMLLPGEDPRAMEHAAQVWPLLARWITPKDATLWRSASYRFHALVAKQWRRGRVFIAGDAAHQQPPFLGQGMCQGLRDAANLGWKLAQVLAGQAPDSLLDTYAQERSAHVKALTSTIKGIGRSICERDPIKARMRDAQLLAEAGGRVKSVPRQNLIPGLEAGCLSNRAHPVRGSLFPQPLVVQGSQMQLLDDAIGGGWRLVLGDSALHWQPHTEPPLRVVRVSSAPQPGSLQETQGVLAQWMAANACRAAIVRPDHYVYGVADSLEALSEELRALHAMFAFHSPQPGDHDAAEKSY